MENTVEKTNEYIPIREISRVTGVNSVTLRAWERRYGLLVPHRTPKGHRLYTQDDIRRVENIQQWLARGVAISKVKSLLLNAPWLHLGDGIGSVWVEIAAQLNEFIDKFQRTRLEHLLADTFAVYPPELVADCLLIPSLENLRSDDFGQGARRVFFTGVLQEYLYAAVSRQRQAARGSSVLVIPSSGSGHAESLLLAHSLVTHQHHASYFGWLDLKEALIIAQATQPDVIVLSGFETPAVSMLKAQLTVLLEKSIAPVVIAGSIASVYPALNVADKSRTSFGITLRQVHAAIDKLVKISSTKNRL